MEYRQIGKTDSSREIGLDVEGCRLNVRGSPEDSGRWWPGR